MTNAQCPMSKWRRHCSLRTAAVRGAAQPQLTSQPVKPNAFMQSYALRLGEPRAAPLVIGIWSFIGHWSFSGRKPLKLSRNRGRLPEVVFRLPEVVSPKSRK